MSGRDLHIRLVGERHRRRLRQVVRDAAIAGAIFASVTAVSLVVINHGAEWIAGLLA